MGPSVPGSYFVDLYKQQPDPWNFARSSYEREKYRVTLASLPRKRYRDACELGCSIGVFTQMLAQRCERLVAIDVSDEAIARARERCRRRTNVAFCRVDLLAEYPAGRYDLTTVCEIGYYFARPDLERLCDRIVRASRLHANVVLVHWTPPTPGHALAAQDVHDLFARDPRLAHVTGFARDTYRLDIFERRWRA